VDYRPGDHVVEPQEPRAGPRSAPHGRRNPPARMLAFGLAAVLVVLVSAIAAVAFTSGKPSGAAGTAASPSATTAAVLPSASSVTATPAATPSPTPAITPTPSRAPAARFAHDSFVMVSTDDLRVRTKPGVAASSVKLEPLLWRGAIAFVLDGPVAASGYQWYLISPLGEADLQQHADPPRLGWVAAAGKDGAPWLQKLVEPCGPNVLGYAPAEFDWPPSGFIALNCLGSKRHSFVADIGTRGPGCDVAPQVTPSHFDVCGRLFFLADPDRDPAYFQVLEVVLDPSIDVTRLKTLAPRSYLRVNVTGQYNHPSARTCRRTRDAGPMPPELVVLGCRSQFVVTRLTVVADP
jgi:hypothetical protein